MFHKMKTILMVVCALAAATTAQDCDALNENCHLWEYDDHTLCQYTGINPKIVERGVSPEDIEVILKAFNDERSKIALGKETRGVGGGQPPAALMYELVYDDDLAAVAQRWADQGEFEHDSCRQDPKARWDDVGQNVAETTGNYDNGQDKSQNWTKAINLWFEEVNNFDGSQDLTDFEMRDDMGHYSQNAWGKTSHVGCGFSMLPVEDTDDYMKLYICNFGPAGNWDGEVMYEVGEPCSKCNGQCDPNVGLCEA